MVSSGDSQALGDIELHDRRSLFTDGFFRQGKSDELAVELTEADLLGVRAVAACVLSGIRLRPPVSPGKECSPQTS